jgi:hypothetical protein
MHEVSAVTDFTAADIPDPVTLGYGYPGRPVIALNKAMFAMRIKALRRAIDVYAESKVLSN